MINYIKWIVIYYRYIIKVYLFNDYNTITLRLKLQFNYDEINIFGFWQKKKIDILSIKDRKKNSYTYLIIY